MKNWLFTLSFMTCLTVLAGCSSSIDKVEQDVSEPKMMVVSSAKPSEVLPAFTTFTWSNEYSLVLSAKSDEDKRDVQQYIAGEIIRYLETKGYRYQADRLKADVTIGFLFSLEDNLANQSIQNKFGLLPNVIKSGVSTKRYEKGSFLLMVLDDNLEQIYWRSGVQGFVGFEADKKSHTTNVMQIVLSLMMGDFPLAGR
ncbi:DUF4136 domain-containing protein [Psychromonas sp. KJ10-10]|uniref:DUF4136 domain-containing protein n=1 Tax=Psychromonas sp. KJ10-10 TaxID=3391823 RepID=UPI0039B4F84D